MKLETNSEAGILYRGGEGVVFFDPELSEVTVDESLEEEDFIEIIGALMHMVYEYAEGDSLPLPANPAHIPYIRQ